MNFRNKKIILGITGSIATYKTPIIAREFIKQGAEVKIVATPSAKEFVSFMVLENLTRHPVISDMFYNKMQGSGAWHIELAHWCDFMLVAPCSATTISKLATGNCDNPLSCVATALPRTTPLIIAPAMDFTMFEHPITQKNIATLQEYNVKIIPPASGELASGLTGKGRLPDIDIIISELSSILNTTNHVNLVNKKILITSGPTQEKIDAVRYISNHSSGKMGVALANAAITNNAAVSLISGNTQNTNLQKNKLSQYIKITSADDMFDAVKVNYSKQDIIIMAAAVADFTPVKQYNNKLKKENFAHDNLTIQLKKTPDILKWLGEQPDKPYLVGFALETDNELENAKNKLLNKNCDMLVLNSANGEKTGFNSDYNTITILKKVGNNEIEILEFEPMLKEKCAEIILQNIIKK